MKALISPIDEIELPDGNIAHRVSEVVEDDNVFEVCPPLYWVDCSSDCDPNTSCFYNNKIIKKPLYVIDENGNSSVEW